MSLNAHFAHLACSFAVFSGCGPALGQIEATLDLQSSYHLVELNDREQKLP